MVLNCSLNGPETKWPVGSWEMFSMISPRRCLPCYRRPTIDKFVRMGRCLFGLHSLVGGAATDYHNGHSRADRKYETGPDLYWSYSRRRLLWADPIHSWEKRQVGEEPRWRGWEAGSEEMVVVCKDGGDSYVQHGLLLLLIITFIIVVIIIISMIAETNTIT